MKKYLILISALVFSLIACSPKDDIAGSVKFYSEPTKEFTVPASVTSIDLSDKQVKKIKTVLNNIDKWVDDHIVDRMQYYFDGEFSFSDSDTVYYFSYEYNVIYYDHYFAEIAAENMQYIKDISAEFLKLPNIESTDINDDTLEVMDNTVAKIGKGTFKTAVEISDEDAKILAKIIETGTWNTAGPTDCASDCVITLNGRVMYYHSDCGTLNELGISDMSYSSSKDTDTDGRSMSLTDSERSNVNTILKKYITLGIDIDFSDSGEQNSDNNITQSTAEEIAASECKVNYDYMDTEFNDAENIWIVRFRENNAMIATQTIRIDAAGNVLSIHYAE